MEVRHRCLHRLLFFKIGLTIYGTPEYQKCTGRGVNGFIFKKIIRNKENFELMYVQVKDMYIFRGAICGKTGKT